jgi:hypothetical protein
MENRWKTSLSCLHNKPTTFETVGFWAGSQPAVPASVGFSPKSVGHVMPTSRFVVVNTGSCCNVFFYKLGLGFKSLFAFFSYLGRLRPPVEKVGASQHAKFAREFEPRTTFSSRQVATPLPNFCLNRRGTGTERLRAGTLWSPIPVLFPTPRE